MATDWLVLLLNSLGLSISKRQVLCLLNDDVDAFCDEAYAVVRAGLESAAWIMVDDTCARHHNRNGVCHVIERKISNGTWSEAGRDARDAPV
jgi:hypothetical protein